MFRAGGWGRKEDAVSSEVTTCCTWHAYPAWQRGCQHPDLHGAALSPQPAPPARLADATWPLQVMQYTPQCLAENLALSLVLWKYFFLSLDKESPSASKGDKSSHSVQNWGCFHGFQQKHCTSVLLVNILNESALLLEGKWLYYLNATYTWVLIKNQFYYNTIFPSFPQPGIYLHKVHERQCCNLSYTVTCFYHWLYICSNFT